MTVDLSIGEVEALVLKACRGSGMAWGLAEDAGRAAGWLTAHNLPGGKAFAAYLSEFDGATHLDHAPGSIDGKWEAKRGTLCPVVTGAVFSDVAGALREGGALEIGEISHPLVFLGFVGLSAKRLKKVFCLEWPGVSATCGADGVAADGDQNALLVQSAEQVRVQVGGRLQEDALPASNRGLCGENDFAELSARAFKTYVPASEQSRLKGAGAGLSDND